MSIPSDYEPLVEIGRGEHTVVSVASRPVFGQLVALKQLTDAARQHPEHGRRLRESFSFLAGVGRFDHLVRPLDYVPDEGCLVLELMNGSLADNLRPESTPLSANEVRGLLRDVLTGLHSIHASGRCHGHLKPSNLLLDGHGRVKIADSPGLFHGDKPRAPQSVVDSKYAAPERVNPDFGPVGPASDLYALGFVVLELLHGPGFDVRFRPILDQAPNAAAGWQRWHAAPDSTLPAGISRTGWPADLTRVLDGLLRKPVAQRYPNAEAALRDLADGPVAPIAPHNLPTLPPPRAWPAALTPTRLVSAPVSEESFPTHTSVVDAIPVEESQPPADDEPLTAYPVSAPAPAGPPGDAADDVSRTWDEPQEQPAPAVDDTSGTWDEKQQRPPLPGESAAEAGRRTLLRPPSEPPTVPPLQAVDESDDVVATVTSPPQPVKVVPPPVGADADESEEESTLGGVSAPEAPGRVEDDENVSTANAAFPSAKLSAAASARVPETRTDEQQTADPAVQAVPSTLTPFGPPPSVTTPTLAEEERRVPVPDTDVVSPAPPPLTPSTDPERVTVTDSGVGRIFVSPKPPTPPSPRPWPKKLVLGLLLLAVVGAAAAESVRRFYPWSTDQPKPVPGPVTPISTITEKIEPEPAVGSSIQASTTLVPKTVAFTITSVPPGARVTFLDDNGKQVVAGKHHVLPKKQKIRVELSGYETVVRDIDPTTEREVDVPLKKLRPDPVVVSIDSDPSDASFTIDGQKGTTPKLVPLEPGERTVTVRRPFYKDREYKFTVLSLSQTVQKVVVPLTIDEDALVAHAEQAVRRVDVNPSDDRAASDCETAVELFPKPAADRLKLARLYRARGYVRVRQGDRPGAVNDYEQAIKHDPNNASYFAELSRVYLAGGNEGKAIANFRLWRKNGCTSVELHRDFGRLLRQIALIAESNQLALFKEAIEALETAAKAKATDWSLWAEAADVCLESLEDFRLDTSDKETHQVRVSKADDNYHKALTLVKSLNLSDDERRLIERRLYRGLGCCKRHNSNPQGALDWLKKAQDLGADPATHNERGRLHFRERQYAEAIREYERAITLLEEQGIKDDATRKQLALYQINRGEVYLVKGRVENSAGDREKGRPLLHETDNKVLHPVLDRSPKDREALALALRLYRLCDDTKAISDLLETIRKLTP